MASRINLRLNGTLRMLPLDKYPGGTTAPANYISGKELHDIAISGSGAIDGQGGPRGSALRQDEERETSRA